MRGGGVEIAYAEEASNNEVIVNDGNYSINGTTYTYSGYFYAISKAGNAWNSGDANNNTFTFNGGTADTSLSYIWAGFSDNGNVSGNTLNLYGGEFPGTNGFFAGGAWNNDLGSATNNTINIGTKIYFGDVGYKYFTAGLGVISTGNTINITDGADINVSSGNNNIGLRGGNATDIANNNSINVTGGTVSASFEGGVIHDGNGIASDNFINISNGIITSGNIIAGRICNATDNTSVVNGNKINITGGNVVSDVIIGGNIDFEYLKVRGTAENNEVNISGGTVSGIYRIIGGSAMIANSNYVNISGGTVNGSVFASYGNDSGHSATDNSINIFGSPDLSDAYLYGYSWAAETHSGNALNIYTKGLTSQNVANFDNMNFYLDGNISNGDTLLTLIGGSQTDLSSTAVKAVVQSGFSLTDGNSVNLLVNEAGITEPQYKTVEIQEGVSYSYTANVALSEDSQRLIFSVGNNTGSDDTSGDDTTTDNTTTDNTSTDNTNTNNTTNSDDDSNNTVNLTNSSNETVYGGYTATGNASNNIVNLYGGSFENIYGGYAPSGETSGNILNVYNKNLTAQNLYNFDNLNFYIPNDASSGDTMLTLTGSAATDLSGVSIRAGIVAGNSNLAVGDTINLLQNSNGFITDSATSYGRLTEGVSLDYGLTVSNSGSNILATIDSVPQDLNGQTQAIPLSAGLTSIKTLDTVLDNNNLPAMGLDFDFEDDNDDADAAEVSDIQVVEPKGWEIFASAGGGSLRTKAGDGAYIDIKSTSFDLGLARTLDNGGAGKFVFAPIIDYAHGSYDSYLADGTHGTGSTRYIAGGGVFRNMWNNGFYVEGSFRAGKVKTDFASDNMDQAFGQRVSYDTDATAMAGHLKVGKNLRLNRNNLLDVYATYYHAHQGGMNADLNPYGDQYRISSADSGRFRIGYRLTTRTSKISRIYTGLAYQYEHADGISATYISRNLSTKSAGKSGSSGMLEIGWQIKPLKNNPWAVDINATGWAGHQRGITAMAKISKSF